MIFLILSFFLSLAEQKVVVGSYNVLHLQNIEKLNADFLILQEQVEIFGLQEVVVNDQNQILEKNIFSGYLYQCVQKVNRLSQENWEAQVILSRYPLKCGFHFLESTGEKKRGVQWAKAQISATQELLFLNTDHESHAWLMLGASDRLKQLRSLKRVLQDCPSSVSFDCTSQPSVIVGDFNTSGLSLWEWKSSHQEIKDTIEFLLPWQHSDACNSSEATFVSFLGGYELDHIFVHGASASCRHTLAEAQGSDHRPIFTKITF